jgi:hypothetical protein
VEEERQKGRGRKTEGGERNADKDIDQTTIRVENAKQKLEIRE